jgi:hypothetical protein
LKKQFKEAEKQQLNPKPFAPSQQEAEDNLVYET